MQREHLFAIWIVINFSLLYYYTTRTEKETKVFTVYKYQTNSIINATQSVSVLECVNYLIDSKPHPKVVDDATWISHRNLTQYKYNYSYKGEAESTFELYPTQIFFQQPMISRLIGATIHWKTTYHLIKITS